MKQKKKSKYYILIADSHLNGEDDFQPFYRMLKRISSLSSDYAVVFLGDNFDLWFAIPDYE